MALHGVPPAADGSEAQLLTDTRQLTFEGRRAGEGYFSADGKALVFQSEREPGNPFFQIYHLDLTTGDTHRVSPGIGKTTCAFFRPGTNRVLFSSTHLDPEAESRQPKRSSSAPPARSAATTGTTTCIWTSFRRTGTDRASSD